MKKLLYILLAIFIIVLGTLYFVGNDADTTIEPVSTEKEELLPYFTSKLIDKATSTIPNYEKLGLGGGVDGFTLLNLYPNLKPVDFTDVHGYQGDYSVQNGKLTFTGNAASNSAVLMQEGMNRLLTNVSTRLQIPVTQKTDIDALLVKMNTNEVLKVGINETISSLGIYITPIEVLEDSRCPATANCIQAGTVRLNTMLESGSGKAPQVFTLNEPITTETREITLVQVEPQSFVGREVKAPDYEFYFEIKKR